MTFQLLVQDPSQFSADVPIHSFQEFRDYARTLDSFWTEDTTNPVLQDANYTLAVSDTGVTSIGRVFVRELGRWIKMRRMPEPHPIRRVGWRTQNDFKPYKHSMYALDGRTPKDSFYIFVTPGKRTAHPQHQLHTGGWSAWADAWDSHMASTELETVYARHVVESLNKTYNVVSLSYHSTPKELLDGFIDTCSYKLNRVCLGWLPTEERTPYLWQVDPGVVTKKFGEAPHDSRGPVKFHTYGYDIECEPLDHRHQQWWSSLSVTGSSERSLQVDAHRERMRKKAEHKNHLMDVFTSLGLDVSFRYGQMILSPSSTARLQEAFEDAKLRRMFVQALRR